MILKHSDRIPWILYNYISIGIFLLMEIESVLEEGGATFLFVWPSTPFFWTSVKSRNGQPEVWAVKLFSPDWLA